VYEFSSLLATALVALAVGGGLGALIARKYSFDGRKQRELERNVNKLLQQQKDYQHEVAMHFTDTAKLLNNLAESYRDVHNHLASGASELCADDAGNILRPIPDAGLAQITSGPEPEAVQPPLDYAPKESPYATGVLNEEFGLDKKAAQAPEGATIVESEPVPEDDAEELKKPA
jgi:uncharacterized membrane-anchored protein YhcB (DUF1043 family)